MSDGMGREFTYLSSHATNRYFIPNWGICDRWDLTLECIRRFYAGEPTPLDSALKKSRVFFELFVDFK